MKYLFSWKLKALVASCSFFFIAKVSFGLGFSWMNSLPEKQDSPCYVTSMTPDGRFIAGHCGGEPFRYCTETRMMDPLWPSLR